MAHAHTEAGFDDEAALKKFAEACDVITYEWENVPVKACDLIDGICPVRPKPDVLRVSQDRVAEKSYISGLRIPVPDFHPAASVEELAEAVSHIGRLAVLKTRRFGYDGKGQARIKADTELAAAFAEIGEQPAILEAFVPFEREVSVIAARDVHGTIACFDVAENVHENGILRSSTIPAKLKPRTATQARHIAASLLDALDYVGVIGVEMFLTVKGGTESLMVNEIAPRVHNSGHWTQNGCVVDQFEQHIRAIAGWPLGNGARHADVVMQNLIGDDMDRVPHLARDPDCALHLYGKAETRPGRKMGHANFVSTRSD